MICFYRNLLPLSVRNWGLGEWGGFHSNARKHSEWFTKTMEPNLSKTPPHTNTHTLPAFLQRCPNFQQFYNP